MEILFTKLQGNGNDFILIDERVREVIPEELKGEFAAQYCQRRFGIGADGVLYLSASEKADLKMRIFNPDRSEAEMCGNGIRCFVKYAVDAGQVRDSCTVETLAGIQSLHMGYRDETFLAEVTLSPLLFKPEQIPATGGGEEYHETIDGMEVWGVNVGVPHAVVEVEDVNAVDLESVAPKIRHHHSFPQGANVDFVQVVGENAVRIRTFERGIEGETYSCGTGATAAAAVLHRAGKVGDTVEVETLGGPLTVVLKEDQVILKGPAETVFVGAITVT